MTDLSKLWQKPALGGIAAATVLLASSLGYLLLEQDGLDDLTQKPCGGLIEKRTLAGVLPDTRDLEVGGGTQPSTKENYHQICFFMTDGRESTVYIEVSTGIVTYDFAIGHEGEQSWTESGQEYERHSDGFVSMSRPGTVDAEVSCPTSEEENNGLVSSVETDRPLRVEGDELQKLLKELALQSLRHVYEKLGCADVPPAKAS